jgi:hypothetical protein
MSISIYIYYIQHPKSLSMMVPAKTLFRDSASEELLVRQKKQCKHVRDEPTSSSSLALSPVFLSNHFHFFPSAT